LLLLQTAAFIGATLCGIFHLHGYAVRLSSVCEVLRMNSKVRIFRVVRGRIKREKNL